MHRLMALSNLFSPFTSFGLTAIEISNALHLRILYCQLLLSGWYKESTVLQIPRDGMCTSFMWNFSWSSFCWLDCMSEWHFSKGVNYIAHHLANIALFRKQILKLSVSNSWAYNSCFCNGTVIALFISRSSLRNNCIDTEEVKCKYSYGHNSEIKIL